MRWRIALAAAQEEVAMPELPPMGAVSLPTPAATREFEAFSRAGYRPLGAQMLRIDLAERLARIAHEGRSGNGDGRTGFAPDPTLATSLGLRPPSFVQLMLALGFRPAGAEDERHWVWRGRKSRRGGPAAPRPGNAFGALAALRPANG
jgi:ATP-dependent RNA helicase SUPV3L1/SUV3